MVRTGKADDVVLRGVENILYLGMGGEYMHLHILIIDKVDFRAKKNLKDKGKQGHYIRKKQSIQQEYVIILNMYTSNNIIS